MSLDFLLSETVTIVVPGSTTDDYGNVVVDWTHTGRTDVKGRLSQTVSTEVTLGRDTVVSDYVVYLHPDAVINTLDRVEAGGVTFEVVGAPDKENAPRSGQMDHIKCHLRHVEG